jgi:hypothetical protein
MITKGAWKLMGKAKFTSPEGYVCAFNLSQASQHTEQKNHLSFNP